ncbi:MAG: hypothetical protein NTV86_05155 [Planctomycetota bacterium]|nr:hypothetical protein [Planctomycetota bacterium]
MSLSNPFSNLAFGEMFQTLLPDFVLAFAFFTALTYAVLGKQFGHQRSAVAMSATLGMALSTGLVWWEQRTQYSIRSLGPLAVGFAIVILGAVMFQAIRQAGGSWAGVGIALGASLIVSELLGVHWLLASQVIQTVTTVALVVGILAFLMRARGHAGSAMPHARVDVPSDWTHTTREVRQDRAVSDQLRQRFRDMERKIDHTPDRSKEPPDVVTQIKKMLPAEGWLTQRMADLRAKAYRAREGHVARIEEIQQTLSKLPPKSRKHAAAELVDRYKELKLDLRIDRLDKAAAENERRIRDLTQQAQQATARYDYPRLLELLRVAETLQKHNSQLFKIMQRTERKLAELAKAAARQVQGGTGK